MAFNITIPNKELQLIQGNDATQKLVVEIAPITFSENVETKLQVVSKTGEALNFADVFETIYIKNTYADFPMDVLTYLPEGDSVILNTMYALQENTSEIYEVDYKLKADFLGEAQLVFTTTDAGSQESKSETAVVRVVTLVQALEEYETQVVKMNDTDVAELEAEYSVLEQKRVLVHAALSGLNEGEEKSALLARYFVAADVQYTSYKLLLLNLSANNRLDLTAVKNIGGNNPYQVAFRDKVLVGSAVQAVRFYPEGFLAARTGNPAYPTNFPEDISSTVVVGQDKLALPSLTVPEGYAGELGFLDMYKIDGVWYRLPYSYAEATFTAEPEVEGEEATEYTAIVIDTIDGHDMSAVIEHGGEFKTAVETEVLQAIADATFTGELVSAQDAESPLTFKVSLAHPLYTTNVKDSFTIDYLVTSSIPFPEGLEATVNQNGLNLGQIALPAGQTEFYLSELGLDGVSKEQLNFRTGTDVLEFTFEGYKPGALQLTAQAIVAEEGEHKIPSSLYSFGQFTGQVQLLDRRGALEHAVANTELTLVGDTIETIEEGIVLTMTAKYPEFHSELDPELKVDTLFSFDKPITPGFTIKVELDDVVVAERYMPEGYEFKDLWLSYLLENVAPALVEHNGKEVTYKVTMHSTDSGLFSLDTKLVTAKEGQFDIPAARTVLSSVVTALEVTDKAGIKALDAHAKELLVNHIEGTETGQTSAAAREALQVAIDELAITIADDDATLNDIENARIAIEAALATFKDTVVKITIDKIALNQTINEAQALLDTVQVGIQVGNTSHAAMGALQDAVDKALDSYTNLPDFVSVFDTEDTTQADIDAANVALAEAITVFNGTLITDTQYVDARLTEYEQAAQDFYNNLRLKLNI